MSVQHEKYDIRPYGIQYFMMNLGKEVGAKVYVKVVVSVGRRGKYIL